MDSKKRHLHEGDGSYSGSPKRSRGLGSDSRSTLSGHEHDSDVESVGSLGKLSTFGALPNDDSSSDESSDDDDEVYMQADENDVVITTNVSSGEIFQTVHGSNNDMEKLEERLATYTKDDWAKMAENLLNTTLDTNCEDRELIMTFQCLHKLFCFRYENDYDVVDRVKAIYPDITTMKVRFKQVRSLFGIIHLELMKRRLLDESRTGRELSRMMTQTAFGIKMSFEGMVSNRLLQKGTDKTMRAMLEEMSPMSLFREVDLPKMKKHQQLIYFYYQTAFRNNYRKDGECLYKPRYNEYNEFVYAYEYVYDISDFVFQSLFPLDQNHYWYQCLTERSGNARQCIDTLTNLKSEYLPDLKRNPNIHAFRNGLFVLSKNMFFYFKKRPGKMWVGQISGPNLTAVKYHDMVFAEEAMEREMNSQKTRSYMSILMQPIHTVFSTQRFNMEERQWIFALLGRLLHPLGKFDTWSVFPYFLGLAGTGKSTSLRLVASLLEPRDLGYLNNTLQKTFALEGIFDKLLYLALDIDEHFQLDQATFQSMVAGEEVSVLRKYKRPLTVVWNSHGGFAGNKLPPWTDNGGSISRRLIVVEFLQPVLRCDPNLFEKCLAMKDRFMKVINSAYLDLAQKFSNRGIKEVIPKKFKQSEAKALLELNILMAFIKDCAEVDDKKDKDFIVDFRDLTKAFKMYCKRNSVKPKQLKYNFYNGVFAKYQIKVITPESTESDAFNKVLPYVLGLKLKPSALEETH